MSFPICNQADILTADVRVSYERTRFDAEGYERTERRAGSSGCPRCGLWWPIIEYPCGWQQDKHGQWIATEYWGEAYCEACELLMVHQPDGRGECYQL